MSAMEKKMKLTASGIVKIEGCNATYTEHGQWAVSRNGKHLGYVDTLTEVPTLLKKRKEDARRELAEVEAEAKQRAGLRMRTLNNEEFLSAIEDIVR